MQLKIGMFFSTANCSSQLHHIAGIAHTFAGSSQGESEAESIPDLTAGAFSMAWIEQNKLSIVRHGQSELPGKKMSWFIGTGK